MADVPKADNIILWCNKRAPFLISMTPQTKRHAVIEFKIEFTSGNFAYAAASVVPTSLGPYIRKKTAPQITADTIIIMRFQNTSFGSTEALWT